MEIQIGAAASRTVTVDKSNTARALGSGLVEVYATPMMVALMEQAASDCLLPSLDAGTVSVGTHINISHEAATPLGMQVTATATVTGVRGRMVDFEVSAVDEKGVVGRGSHVRAVMDEEKFMRKAAER